MVNPLRPTLPSEHWMDHGTYNLKLGYLVPSSFFTSSSTLTSYSVTRSTEFFFSSTLPEDRMACEPWRMRSPAVRASLVVKSRIDFRSAAASSTAVMISGLIQRGFDEAVCKSDEGRERQPSR